MSTEPFSVSTITTPYVPPIFNNDSSNSDIFIKNVIDRLAIFNSNVEDNISEKIFINVLDYVGTIEFYTMFSTRTFKQCEEFLYSHEEITSLIFNMNMLLQGYMEVNVQYSESILKLFTGLINSVSTTFLDTFIKGSTTQSDVYHDDIDTTSSFLKQIMTSPTYALYRSFGTWHKVFVLLHYNFGDIVSYIDKRNQAQ